MEGICHAHIPGSILTFSWWEWAISWKTCQDIPCPGWDSNATSPERKSEAASPVEPTCLVRVYRQFPDLRNSHVPEDLEQGEVCTSSNWVCKWPAVCATNVKTPTHWKLVGRSMTVPPPVLSPSSILRSLSSHCTFIPIGEKFGARLKLLLHFVKVFEIAYLKLCNLKLC